MPELKPRANSCVGEEMRYVATWAIDCRALAQRVALVGVLLLVSCKSGLAQSPDSRTKPAVTQTQLPTRTAANLTAISPDANSAAVRAETIERLKEYTPVTTTGTESPNGSSASVSASSSSSPAALVSTRLGPSSNGPALNEPLPVLLENRLRLLQEYDTAQLDLRKAIYPDPSPEQEAADARAELAKLQKTLQQAETRPESILPPLFCDGTVKASSEAGSQMRDAIELVSNELKEWRSKLENVRAETAKINGLMNARRADRDALFERVTMLTARTGEYKSAVTDAQSAAARRLAQERLVNFEWQLRLESLRLRIMESQIAMEAKLAEVRDLRAEVFRAHAQIAVRTLEPMQLRFHSVVEAQERDLTRAKVQEENKARSTDDPLERFHARHTAELLALEAQVIRYEQDLVISPAPAYEEQKTKADHADFDFANIKELLDDGKVSRLDAIRLNNEFRRIGPERDRLVKNELARSNPSSNSMKTH